MLKKKLEFVADAFNRIITLVIVVQFFRGDEIGLIQLSVVVIGMLVDFIAKIY